MSKYSLIAVGLAALSLSALSLTSCKPQSATTAAQEQLQQIIEEVIKSEDISNEDDTEAILQILSDFRATANANEAHEQSKLSILHLAAIYKKIDLMRCLLADGADPNAQSLYKAYDSGDFELGDTVLGFACYDMLGDTNNDEMIACIDLLLAHGADISKLGPMNMRVMDTAGIHPEHEEVFRHVRKLTPNHQKGWIRRDGVKISSFHMPSLHSWTNSLYEMIQEGYDVNEISTHEKLTPLHININKGGELGYIDLLLKNGAKINAVDIHGRSPLYLLCSKLIEMKMDDAKELQIANKISFLLNKGADPYQVADADVNFPGFCPYDFLSSSPEILQSVIELGHKLEAPAIILTEPSPQMLALLARLNPASDEEILELAPQWEKVRDILLHDGELCHHELYAPAIKSALNILADINPAQANEIVANLPVWSTPEKTVSSCGCADTLHLLDPLIEAMNERSEYQLPAPMISSVLNSFIKDNRLREACKLVPLLNRIPEGKAIIETLRESPELALRAGAVSAQLEAAGLPQARDGEVQKWLALHDGDSSDPRIAKALELTTLNEIWFEAPTEEQTKRIESILLEIGAQKAADFYRQIIPLLQDPEKLDNALEEDQSWVLELEELIGLYILNNKEAFLK